MTCKCADVTCSCVGTGHLAEVRQLTPLFFDPLKGLRRYVESLTDKPVIRALVVTVTEDERVVVHGFGPDLPLSDAADVGILTKAAGQLAGQQ